MPRYTKIQDFQTLHKHHEPNQTTHPTKPHQKTIPTQSMTEDNTPTRAAIYCRVSTKSQETESQEEVCTRFVENHPDIDEWRIYKEKETGHNDDREKYVRLKNAIGRGEYEYFVCSEFSRISRNAGEIKEFVSLCFEQGMGFEVIQGAFSAEPDEDEITQTVLKMVADILAGIATMEQLQKIDRIKRGLKYARENKGKFTHRAPAGFRIDDDGFIHVNDEEFTALREALLEHHYNGTQWSTLEEFAPVSRSALSKIYNNEERRNLYVYAKGYDDYGLLDDALENAGWKKAVKVMKDTPDRIDPEQERKQRKQWNRVGDDERAMMKTFQDIVQLAQEQDEPLSEEELLNLYEQNRNTAAKTVTNDD